MVIPYVFCMMPPTHIHTKGKMVRTPADLKGLKIHGAEYVLLNVLNNTGATAVQLDVADMYMGLERGVLDGVMNHFPVCLIFRILPLLTSHTVFGEGGINMTPMGVVWNEEKWKSYPTEVQKIITEAVPTYIEAFYKNDVGVQVAADGFAKKNNHTFTELSEAEIKVWYDLVKKPIHDKWMAEAEANGLPGKTVYATALDLIKQYKNQ
jgi:TRAP-type C4-dicarboxylate transport system substrate-binding protein